MSIQSRITRGIGYGAVSVSMLGFYESEEDVLHSGHGDNDRIYKPTGLGGYKKKTIIEDRLEIQEQVAEVASSELTRIFDQDTEVIKMSLSEIDQEISILLHKEFRNREEEALLVILIAANC